MPAVSTPIVAQARVAPSEPAPATPEPVASEPPGIPATPTIHNKCDRPDRGARFHITIKRDAELQDLVEWMMSVSCQKFIWAPALRTKTVNIVAPEPVTVSEAYAAFYAALATIGATVEPAGDYYRIVESQAIEGGSFPVYGPGATVPNDGRIVTKVWRPDESQRPVAASLLEGLKTQDGTVRTIGDVVVVTDTGARIRTLERLLEQLETPPEAHRKIHLYGVRHGEAEALAEVVRSVFSSDTAVRTVAPTSPTRGTASSTKGGKKGKNAARAPATARASSPTSPSSAPTVAIDARTGTLVILATDQTYAAILRLLEELDVDAGEGRETLHVIELEHIDAAEVEGVLNKLSGATPQSETSGGRKQPATAGPKITGPVQVTAHQATQTLIVSATALDFAALARIVDRIDHPRRQLYIEVYLLEVRSELGREVGVGAHYGDNAAGGLAYGSSAPDGTNSTTLDSSLLSGFAAGILGPTISGSGELLGLDNDIPSFGVTLQAAETQEDIDIVAEPHLYAAENEQAIAEFGETVPVQTGSTVPLNNSAAAFNNVSTEDITLKLEVTPYVADDETVSLDIVLEDRQLGARDTETGNFRTLKRKLDLKKVVAHPGQPLVLGGLSRELESVEEGRVPGLGNIPVLGWLFRKRRRRKEKVSLLMVMVPHLIDSPDDARRIHAMRMKERMDFIVRYTAFKRRTLTTNVNYRKTAGLLSAVNVAAVRQRGDEAFAMQAEAELQHTTISTTIDPQAPTPTLDPEVSPVSAPPLRPGE